MAVVAQLGLPASGLLRRCARGPGRCALAGDHLDRHELHRRNVEWRRIRQRLRHHIPATVASAGDSDTSPPATHNPTARAGGTDRLRTCAYPFDAIGPLRHRGDHRATWALCASLACLLEQRGAHGVLLTLADAFSVRIGATLWPTALASGQVLGHSRRLTL
jgi:hypothetical protein